MLRTLPRALGGNLHGDPDLLRGVQALGRVLQAAVAVWLGEGVAASAAPRHGGVGVIRCVGHPGKTAESLGVAVTRDTHGGAGQRGWVAPFRGLLLGSGRSKGQD